MLYNVIMKYARIQIPSGKVYDALLDGSSAVVLEDGEEKDRLLLSSVRLLSPSLFSKAVCIGLNYRDHAEEFGLPIPETPIVFLKPSTSLCGPEDNVIYPSICHRLDYEAELAVVISKPCRNVSQAEALDYVLGYTIANDITARDLQPKNGQWTIAKGFDTFMPLGPYISDEVTADGSGLYITSRVNGRTMQESNTSNLIFTVPFLISYISACMTLLPGDVISTGTPGGISGMARGDVVEIEIEGLGILRNTIA